MSRHYCLPEKTGMRIIITKREEKEDKKNIILRAFSLIQCKTDDSRSRRRICTQTRRDIFNNNSFPPFADTPLKSLETIQEEQDGEGDAKMRYKVRRACIFSSVHLYLSFVDII